MSDDPGLLGNLPRSRPGTRSDKRTSGAAASQPAAASKPAATAKRARPKAAQAKNGPRARPAKPRAKVANPKPRPAPESQPGDPVSEALKTGARLAGAGARTANGVAREILRRLPRP